MAEEEVLSKKRKNVEEPEPEVSSTPEGQTEEDSTKRVRIEEEGKLVETKTEGSELAIIEAPKEGKKPGDWSCPSCTHLNYDFRKQCQKCSTARPGGDTAGFHEGDWRCSSCNHHNYAFRNSCQRCQTVKAGSKNPADWRCPTCNDLNYASRVACRKCYTPKPFGGPGAPAYGAWGGNAGGFQAGGGGPGWGGGGYGGGWGGGGYQGGWGGGAPTGVGGVRAGDRPGDWNCPSCNCHNYASRNNCRKCNATKTESAVTAFQSRLAAGQASASAVAAGGFEITAA